MTQESTPSSGVPEDLSDRLAAAGRLLCVDHVMHRRRADRIAAVSLTFEHETCLILADPRTSRPRIEMMRYKPDEAFRFESASLDHPWSAVSGLLSEGLAVDHDAEGRPATVRVLFKAPCDGRRLVVGLECGESGVSPFLYDGCA